MPGITPVPRIPPAASVLGGRARKAHRAQPEAQEQRRFVQWWRNQPGSALLLAMATLNGVHLSKLQAKLAKAAGMEKGPPDWMLFARGSAAADSARVPKIGLALEFKRPDGPSRPTTEQRRWHRALRELGFRVEIVTTAEEASRVVQDYLSGIAWQVETGHLPRG